MEHMLLVGMQHDAATMGVLRILQKLSKVTV